LLTIWLGFGVLPKIIITALLTFFPVLVNVLTGLQAADPAFVEIFHSWNANQEIFIGISGWLMLYPICLQPSKLADHWH